MCFPDAAERTWKRQTERLRTHLTLAPTRETLDTRFTPRSHFAEEIKLLVPQSPRLQPCQYAIMECVDTTATLRIASCTWLGCLNQIEKKI